jgi:hypothetical protein
VFNDAERSFRGNGFLELGKILHDHCFSFLPGYDASGRGGWLGYAYQLS